MMVGIDLVSCVLYGLILQFIVSVQRVIFNSHVYADIQKVQIDSVYKVVSGLLGLFAAQIQSFCGGED